MNRRWIKSIAMAALALTFGIVSCDSLPTETSSSPSAAVSAVAPVSSSVVEGYYFIEGNPENGSILDLSKVIGLLGGTLNIGKHSLVVPQGAVLVPTLFQMEVVRNGHIEVELHAFLQNLLGLVDIGGKGFLKPVNLSLSYANATNVGNAANLKIALLNEDGSIKEILPSVVDTQKKTVSAKLPHFSRYAMIGN